MRRMRGWTTVTRTAPVAALAAASMLLAAAPAAAGRYRGLPFTPPRGRPTLNLNSVIGSNWQGPGGPADPGAPGGQSAEGVVQSVGPRSVVLRELDGTLVTVPVGLETQVFLDGRPDVLADVRPGYVVAATWVGDAPASVLVFVRSS